MVWLQNKKRKKPDKTPNNIPKADMLGYETCVVCGRKTATPKTRPLSRRQYYVEGCGQLCEGCYVELFL